MTAPTHISSDRWSRAMSDLVATLEDDIDQSKDASTTVDSTSAAAQAVLKVDATTSFTVGETTIIGPGTAREEAKVIASIQSGTSLTMTANLAYEHTAAQADPVWQGWYNYDMNRAETVDDPDDLGPPVGGPWPMCRLYAGARTLEENLTGYDVYLRTIFIVGWVPVQRKNPTDQAPDESYAMLRADIIRAINADWTLGGNVYWAQPLVDERVTQDTYPKDLEKEEDYQYLPMVGVLIPLEVQYAEKRGDPYN